MPSHVKDVSCELVQLCAGRSGRRGCPVLTAVTCLLSLGTASDGYRMNSYHSHYDQDRYQPSKPSYEDAFYQARDKLQSSSMLPYYSQRGGYRGDVGGYAPENESTDDYDIQVSTVFH